MTFLARPPKMLEQIRDAWRLGTPSRPLAVMFGITSTELSHLVRLHGWQTRAETFWAAGKTAAERAAEVRAAEATRAVELYGDAIEDVRLLRSRGFVVVREGERCRVGKTLCTLAALRAKAARERRLLDAGRPKENSKNSPITQGRAAPDCVRPLGHNRRLQAVQAPLHGRPRRPAPSAEVVTAPAA